MLMTYTAACDIYFMYLLLT